MTSSFVYAQHVCYCHSVWWVLG